VRLVGFRDEQDGSSRITSRIQATIEYDFVR